MGRTISNPIGRVSCDMHGGGEITVDGEVVYRDGAFVI
jgi:hypothetical protein